MVRASWTTLERNVAAIPDFLRGDQPDDAIIDHFGFSVHCGGMLMLSVAVCGWNGGPGGERGTAETCRVHIECEPHHPDEPEPDPISEDEAAEVRLLLERAGLTVVDEWRGGSWVSYGCTFPEISPSVKRARERYSEGCAKKGHHVFCGPGAHNEDHRDCTWRDGFERTVPPTWVAVAWDFIGGGGDSQTDDTHGLEEVRRVLTKITPLLVEMGVHAQTVNAGRKGEIVGELGDLTFKPTQGHGVCLPAEVAAELVRLAILGHEVES